MLVRLVICNFELLFGVRASINDRITRMYCVEPLESVIPPPKVILIVEPELLQLTGIVVESVDRLQDTDGGSDI